MSGRLGNKTLSDASAFLTTSRMPPRAVGIPTSQQHMVSDAERMTCFVITGAKNSTYWGAVITLLYSVLASSTVPLYTMAGFMLSFMVAAQNSPADALARIARIRGFAIRIVFFRVENGVIVVSKEDAEASYILGELDNNIGDLTVDNAMVSVDHDFSDLSSLNCSLGAYIGVIRYVFFLAAKAVTSGGEAANYADRKITALVASGTVDGTWLPGPILAREMVGVIATSYNLRIGMVQIIQDADSTGGSGGEVAAAIGQTAQFLRNAGLTGLDLVVRHLIIPLLPILGLSVLTAEVMVVMKLLEVYKMRGNEAPFIKFIGATEANNFSPGVFPNLFAIALGIATVIDPNMGAYGGTSTAAQMRFFSIGVRIGKTLQGSISQNLVSELDLDRDEVKSMLEMVKEQQGDQEEQ